IARCSASEVDHDVRVNEGNLCVTNATAFHSALIDKTTGAHTFDFLEDRAGARVPLQPGMLRAAPAEVFLHDAMNVECVFALQLEGRGEHDVLAVMEYGIVIAELYIVRAYRF